MQFTSSYATGRGGRDRLMTDQAPEGVEAQEGVGGRTSVETWEIPKLLSSTLIKRNYLRLPVEVNKVSHHFKDFCNQGYGVKRIRFSKTNLWVVIVMIFQPR
jgi:hypothetical protein